MVKKCRPFLANVRSEHKESISWSTVAVALKRSAFDCLVARPGFAGFGPSLKVMTMFTSPILGVSIAICWLLANRVVLIA